MMIAKIKYFIKKKLNCLKNNEMSYRAEFMYWRR